MGAFAEAVSVFAPLKIPIIPTYPDKPSHPMVNQPAKFGVRASLSLVTNERYRGANAALIAGKRSRITALDLDTSDDAVFAELEKGAGPSPIVVRTPSGGFHAFYRNAGERRRIRTFGENGLPLDVIGDGLLVLPPSSRPATENKKAGCYELVRGGWADLERLPPIRAGFLPALAASVANNHTRPLSDLKGGDGRNNTLFQIARCMAAQSSSLDELQTAVLAVNSTLGEPLSEKEAMGTIRSAWRYKLEGRLIVPGSRFSVNVVEDFERIEYIPAFYLLGFLRLHHSLDHVFAIVPEAIALTLRIMSKDTVRAAREYLIGVGYLTLVARGGLPGGSKLPNQYRLSMPKP